MIARVSVHYSVGLAIPSDDVEFTYGDLRRSPDRRHVLSERIWFDTLRIDGGGLSGQYVFARKDGTKSEQRHRIGWMGADQVDALLAKMGYAGLMKALDAAYEHAFEAASDLFEAAVREFKP